ncbi:hypothetical protein [Marinomonas sp. IMCC 4694]|uniref:hypothetical protein n=1 Tax=Marinomonas sp. IMCC 4694 TaxID=2605432 RepID=UPI0011E6F13A|nr:hypothetical protein [Marinomonas sp. IMCC 4694]TYL47371.1 hypothetical protein FXV75_05060 [Marinomonas sp. IMCC 4694]
MATLTTAALLLFIVGFLALVIFLQLKEQARLDRLRKVAFLNNQLRQVRRYLDDIPPQYQPKDMRLWLYSRKVAIYEQLLVLHPDPTLARRHNHIVEEMNAFQNSKHKRRAKPINDELLIMEIKRQFESFKVFLALCQKDSTISSDVAHRYKKLMNFYHFKVNADYHSYLARQAFLNGLMENSVKMYKEALAQLAPVKDTPEAQPTILKLNDLIREIEEDSALQKAEEEMARSSDNKADAELDSEWDKFMEDSNRNIKKRF